MSITDELRKEARGFGRYIYTAEQAEHLTAIADRIDAEHQKAIRELNNLAEASVLLPVDADGERWHIGDRTESGQTIQAMGLNKHGWYFIGTVNDIDPRIHRHHHAPTVEDVLEELLREYDRDDSELTNGEIIEMFAKRLTLAEGEDA